MKLSVSAANHFIGSFMAPHRSGESQQDTSCLPIILHMLLPPPRARVSRSGFIGVGQPVVLSAGIGGYNDRA